MWRVGCGGVRLPLLPEARPAGVEAEGSPSRGRLPSTLGSAQSGDSRRDGVGPTALGWRGLRGAGRSQASRGTQGATLARITARITIGCPEVPPCVPVPPGRPRTGRGPVGGHMPAVTPVWGSWRGGLPCPGPWRETPGTPPSRPPFCLFGSRGGSRVSCETQTSLGPWCLCLLEPLPRTQRSSSIRTSQAWPPRGWALGAAIYPWCSQELLAAAGGRPPRVWPLHPGAD